MLTNLPRLPETYLPIVERYRDNRPKLAPLTKAIEADKGTLLHEIPMDVPGVVCGPYILSTPSVASSKATITLSTGESIPLADVEMVVLKDKRIFGITEVLKIYGGASGYRKLEVRP